MFLLLSMLLLINCSENRNQSKNTFPDRNEKLLNENKTEFKKVHSLKKNDGAFIADVYVKFINDSIFTDLYAVNRSDTLYSINRNTFLNKEG